MVYFTACAIISTLAAKVLKCIIKQPRPDSTTRKTTHGMPSSHSTAISYFAIYLQQYVTQQHYSLEWMIASACLLGFSLVVIWSRVQLGHHTQAQVIVGALLGACLAVFFFSLWNSYVSHKLPALLFQIDFLANLLATDK